MKNPLNDFHTYKINSISRFFRSHDFLRSLAMTSLMLACSVLLYFTQYQAYILGTCVGILLTSFNDIPGKATNRIWAMLLSTLLSGLIIVIINLLHFSVVLTSVFITFATFGLYMLSAFGSRAELLGFVGALAISLGFVGYHEGRALLVYALTVLGGGMCYTTASWLYHLFTKGRQIDEQLGELAKLTANYLKQGIALAKQDTSTQAVSRTLLDLQINIIEKQGNLGVAILSDRTIAKPESRRNRQMFLLKQLIDFMELAVTTPSNLARIKALQMTDQEILVPFVQIAEQIRDQLFVITQQLRSPQTAHIVIPRIDLAKAEQATKKFYEETTDLNQARQTVLAMHHLLDHFQLQIGLLAQMATHLNHPETITTLALSENDQALFYTKESYNRRQISQNLHVKSPIFRQSVRMAFGFMLAYLLGTLFHIEKAYWIMLTTLLILRLSYGLTVQRAIKRVVGTAIGAGLALALLQVSSSLVYYTALAALGMLFSFSLLTRNYTLASLAITLCIIFSFALLGSRLYVIIAFRFIDTLIGAVISVGVAYTVLPFWEFKSFERNINAALKANQAFLQEVLRTHPSALSSDTQYRLKRKSAYLASSLLNANLQRSTQDPKSKQGKYSLFYELVALNHAIVSSITVLGNYFKYRDLVELRPILHSICGRLHHDFDTLLQQANTPLGKPTNTYEQLETYWQQLETQHNQQHALGNMHIAEVLKPELREAYITRQEIQKIQDSLEQMGGHITNSEMIDVLKS
jgi:uncharacterized membrane protein YccC